MPTRNPAIATIDRPRQHPALKASDGTPAWEMRVVAGPVSFLQYPSRIVTDDLSRAARAFATDLVVHGQRTGTRPWLILPEATAKIQGQPPTHLALLCAEQPAAAARTNAEISARLDGNPTGSPLLIGDIHDGRWRITRYDPVYRDSGNIRLIIDLTATEILIPDIAIDTPKISDADELGYWMREKFWTGLNPRLDDPFIGDNKAEAAREAPLDWRRGNEETLASLITQIAWSQTAIEQNEFPFEIKIDTACDETEGALLADQGRLRDAAIPLIERALAENCPTGWTNYQEGKNALSRRSNWHRRPLRLTITVPVPSFHQRLRAITGLTTLFKS